MQWAMTESVKDLSFGKQSPTFPNGVHIVAKNAAPCTAFCGINRSCGRARSPNAPQSRGKEKQLKVAQVTKGTSLRRRTVRVSCASFECRARDGCLSVRFHQLKLYDAIIEIIPILIRYDLS